MKTARIIVLVISILALAAIACGGGASGGQQANSPSGDRGGQTASTPSGDSGGQQAAPTKESGGASGGGTGGSEEELNLSSVTEGLASLKSYKGHMVMQFDGKDDKGEVVKGSMDMYQEATTNPKGQHISVTTSDTPQAKSGTFEMVSIEGTNYVVMQEEGGEKSCISMSAEQDLGLDQGLFSPDTLGGINSAKLVNTETVNGVKAKHYTWKEGGSSLAAFGFTNGKGDVWVAVDGNYVVKYVAEATGKGAMFSQNQAEGTIKIEYNLTEVNSNFTITRPEGCEEPAKDIPILSDAQDKAQMGDIMTYKTATAFAEVVEFYKTELVAQGWQASGEPTEMEGVAMLEFTKEGRKASVTISEDKDNKVVNVMVTVSKE